MSEFGFVLSLGALVAVWLLYVRRVSWSGVALCWGLAWLTLYLSGLLIAWEGAPPSALLATNLLSGVFCGLQLAGALAHRGGMRVPVWPVVVGLCLGAVGGTLRLLDLSAQASLFARVEVALLLAAALILWRGAGPGLHPERIVALGLLAIAGLDLVDPSLREVDLPSLPLFVAWGAASVGLGLAQVLVFVERASERERRLRVERDLLHAVTRAAATHTDLDGVIAALVDGLRARCSFRIAGVWMLSADGRTFEGKGSLGELPGLPKDLRRIPADLPLARLARDARGPVFLEDLHADPRVRLRGVRESGVRGFAMAPLRWRGRDLGVLVAGRDRPGRFKENEHRFLAALADEVALALAHVGSIAERDEQRRTLAAQERTLRAVVEAMPVGVLLIDREGRVRIQNRLGAEQWDLGVPESLVGRRAGELGNLAAVRVEAGHARLRAAREAVQAHPEQPIEPFEVRLHGRTLLISSYPVFSAERERIGELWTSRDVTEERRLEERLRHAQRMETLGTLAGGVAHDFNNQLTAVLGNARLVLEGLDRESPNREALIDLEAAAQHCAELTRGLLTFARRSPSEPEPVNVEKMLHQVETVLRSSLAPDVRLEVRVAPDVRPVLADASQLRRALTNLAVNARDAVQRSGSIVLAAENHPDLVGAIPSSPGRVVLTVRDTGRGMDARTRERLFDPFFTTKPVGKGTGLGLAIVHGIAESHGASIEVDSEPGRGTAVRLLWPAAAGKSAEVEEAAAAQASGSGETILVADDEPVVRRLARRTLERSGYLVIEARDGEQAVEMLRRHPGRVDLALLDLTMPRRDGLEALEGLRALQPSLPAVLMSGHLASDAAVTPAGVRLLPKPFRPDGLARIVRDALQAAARSSRP